MRYILFYLAAAILWGGNGLSLRDSFAAEGGNAHSSVTNRKAATKQALMERRAAEDNGRIVGGEAANRDQWPWMVALLRPGSGAAFDRQFCGAALIASQWVITAAHCTAGESAGDVVAGLKLHNLKEDTGELIAVSEIFVHPNYDSNTLDSDISLLRLAQPVSSPFTTVSLGDQLSLIGIDTQATVIGWGALDEANQSFPATLQQVAVPMIKCTDHYTTPGEITDNMICAGTPSGGIDSCQGDSGGPLMVLDGAAWKQVGIVSWGIGCARPNAPGVYTNVYNYLSWIQEKMGGSTTEPPTPSPTEPIAGNLKQGWNLIASQQSSTLSIADYFAARNFSDNTQPFISVWAWDTSSQNWRTHFLSSSIEDVNQANNSNFLALTNIAPGVGYWINMKEEATYSYNAPPKTRPLAVGQKSAGALKNSGDRQLFRLEISNEGNYTIGTKGSLDTVGRLLDSEHNLIAENDDGYSANFQLVQSLEPGVYYVEVQGYKENSGAYELLAEY